MEGGEQRGEGGGVLTEFTHPECSHMAPENLMLWMLCASTHSLIAPLLAAVYMDWLAFMTLGMMAVSLTGVCSKSYFSIPVSSSYS